MSRLNSQTGTRWKSVTVAPLCVSAVFYTSLADIVPLSGTHWSTDGKGSASRIQVRKPAWRSDDGVLLSRFGVIAQSPDRFSAVFCSNPVRNWLKKIKSRCSQTRAAAFFVNDRSVRARRTRKETANAWKGPHKISLRNSCYLSNSGSVQGWKVKAVCRGCCGSAAAAAAWNELKQNDSKYLASQKG